MNPWLLVFLVSLVLFLLLVDWHSFKYNFWIGLAAMLVQSGLHPIMDRLDYWHYFGVNKGLPNLYIFSNQVNIFILGLIFMMAILYVQLLPRNYYLQLLHAVVWMFFYRLMLHIAEHNNMVQFIHFGVWRLYHIIPVTMLTLACLKNIMNEGMKLKKDEGINRNSF